MAMTLMNYVYWDIPVRNAAGHGERDHHDYNKRLLFLIFRIAFSLYFVYLLLLYIGDLLSYI